MCMSSDKRANIFLDHISKRMSKPAATDTKYFDKLVSECVYALRKSYKEVYVFQYEHVVHIQREIPVVDYKKDQNGIYRVFIPRR